LIDSCVCTFNPPKEPTMTFEPALAEQLPATRRCQPDDDAAA
jgi:hypothetical protein